MENQTTTEEDSYEQFLVKKDVQFLEKIHQVIEENMDDSDFNIDTIASGIGLSRSAFFKKLKSLTGLAPVDLVKEIRLNKSIELIKNTDCLLYTSPSPRDLSTSRMPSSAPTQYLHF